MTTAPTTIIREFDFDGDAVSVHPNEFGHINETFVVQTAQSNRVRRYILQRINQNVFHQPDELMTNIIQVTAFLREKIGAEGGDPERETLTLIPTRQGAMYFVSPAGEYWRAYRFIEGARAYQQVESLDHLFQAARTFGRFLRRLGDFPPEALHVTIPDFHHTPKRFRALMQAVARDTHNRARTVRPFIKQAQAREEKLSQIVAALAVGQIPSRVTHNDTKFDNVLIDDITGEGVCVLDLDTVMPGSALYDFGDFVRTGANTGAEDEPDPDRVSLNLEAFKAIARGFLHETADTLTPQERDWLPLGAWIITFEQAMRFLTDYLDGDIYYRIHRPEQNLDRARSQFKLAADMEANEDAMSRIIARNG
jgi:aminoglycoside phosphotransferase (APT) family kinase protein